MPDQLDPWTLAAGLQGGWIDPSIPQAMAPALAGKAQEIAQLPQQALDASEQLRLTGQYNPAPAVQTAALLAGGGLGGAEEGAAGIFGGRLAKGNDWMARQGANFLEAQGASPYKIWQDTGWYKGPDNKWRFEIDDSNAKFIRPNSNIKIAKLGDILDHDTLYQNYPHLRDTDVYFSNSKLPGAASYNPGKNMITMSSTAKSGDLQTILHETQHAVQDYEGFAPGAGVQDIRNRMDPLITKHLLEGTMTPEEGANSTKLMDVAKRLYWRHAGEAEARNVVNRQMLSPDLRQQFGPWATADVHPNWQIVAPPFKP